MTEVYLDNAATTMVCKEAAETAFNVMTQEYGNPSSTHTKGRQANDILKSSRKAIANAIGCKDNEIFFTSCGSEGDNWAIINGAEYMKRKGKHVITSSVEHDAVRKSAAHLEKLGYEVTYLEPNTTGAIDVESVISALRDDTILVSLMMVNNETGAITDIQAISKALKAKKSIALLHTDAVQGFMKVPFKAKTLGADLITISGHKIHGPKGIGALYIKEGIKLPAYIMGGSQENGYRAGTESLPLIAAFAEATKIASSTMSEYTTKMSSLQDYTKNKLTEMIPGIVFIGGGAPHIMSISMPGFRSEVLMNYLESKGIYVSKSSACKKGGRSHVLEMMNLEPSVIDGTIRVSMSRYTTQDDMDYFCKELNNAFNTLHHN